MTSYSKGYKRCGWLTARGRCTTLVPDRKHCYCAVHRPMYEDQGRKRRAVGRTDKGFYSTAAWKRLRRSQLAIEPFCSMCPCTGHVVDHIIPHRGNPDLFFDSSNLQTLCKKCHDSVTALEMTLRRSGKNDKEIGAVKLRMRIDKGNRQCQSIF